MAFLNTGKPMMEDANLCHALRAEGRTLQLTVPVLPVLLTLEDLVCHMYAALLERVLSRRSHVHRVGKPWRSFAFCYRAGRQCLFS